MSNVDLLHALLSQIETSGDKYLENVLECKPLKSLIKRLLLTKRLINNYINVNTNVNQYVLKYTTDRYSLSTVKKGKRLLFILHCE